MRIQMPFCASLYAHCEFSGTASESGLNMRKLYRSALHQNHWVAYVSGCGWVVFPASENGWEMRKPARGLDPLYLREAPARLAADAGFPQGEPVELLNVA
jgi:hypothetical protein